MRFIIWKCKQLLAEDNINNRLRLLLTDQGQELAENGKQENEHVCKFGEVRWAQEPVSMTSNDTVEVSGIPKARLKWWEPFGTREVSSETIFKLGQGGP